ncbi:retrovirus-related pol polyprotein from transposon TNT 1-94 [Tanacetum coccineum]|uniref:Retrovirus-related pol polyprotein from transposon TNT 1-94 n=1 Tax=Tanacetum coccineum TaxID=301880 RepID=A0ABQ5AE64_9ASTR
MFVLLNEKSLVNSSSSQFFLHNINPTFIFKLNGILCEEVYVSQPDGFVDQDNPNHVYKLKKALYGLKQAPQAWYDLLSSFLLSQKFSKGAVDHTLFTQKEGKDILLMSMMGKMSFFLGLQISQSPKGIFLSQSKYALEIIKKYGIEISDLVDTPMVEKSKLDEDPLGKAVDPTRYRKMIGSLMYLTSRRPDLVFIVCMCAPYHAKPTEKHLHALLQMLIMLVAKIPEEVHLAIPFHQRVSGNGVVELYFVRTEYQLADIFTKALGRERLEFLINKLGMRSMSLETLKGLVEEEEE